MSLVVSAYFSEYGVPKTGLSPTVKIRDVSDGSLSVDSAAMTEVGDGAYKYTFAGYDSGKDYVFICDRGNGTPAGNARYAIGTTDLFQGTSSLIAIAWFSEYGEPVTGLSPTIDIYNLTDDTQEITAAAMTELGDGFYKYTFSTYVDTDDYFLLCDGGATLEDNERYTSSGSQRTNARTILMGSSSISVSVDDLSVAISVDDLSVSVEVDEITV